MKTSRLAVPIIGAILILWSLYAFMVFPLSESGKMQSVLFSVVGLMLTFGGAFWAGTSVE